MGESNKYTDPRLQKEAEELVRRGGLVENAGQFLVTREAGPEEQVLPSRLRMAGHREQYTGLQV